MNEEVTTVWRGERMPLDRAEELMLEERRARQLGLDEARREAEWEWHRDRGCDQLWAPLREGF